MIESIIVEFADGYAYDIEWEEDAWNCEDGRTFTRLDEAIMHAWQTHTDDQLRIQRSTLTPR